MSTRPPGILSMHHLSSSATIIARPARVLLCSCCNSSLLFRSVRGELPIHPFQLNHDTSCAVNLSPFLFLLDFPKISYRICFRISYRTCFRISYRICFRISHRICFRISHRTCFRTSYRICFRISYRICFRISDRTRFRISHRTCFRVSDRTCLRIFSSRWLSGLS